MTSVVVRTGGHAGCGARDTGLDDAAQSRPRIGASGGACRCRCGPAAIGSSRRTRNESAAVVPVVLPSDGTHLLHPPVRGVRRQADRVRAAGVDGCQAADAASHEVQPVSECHGAASVRDAIARSAPPRTHTSSLYALVQSRADTRTVNSEVSSDPDDCRCVGTTIVVGGCRRSHRCRPICAMRGGDASPVRARGRIRRVRGASGSADRSHTTYPTPQREEQTRAWILGQPGQRERGEALDLAIARRADDALLGAIGLGNLGGGASPRRRRPLARASRPRPRARGTGWSRACGPCWWRSVGAGARSGSRCAWTTLVPYPGPGR